MPFAIFHIPSLHAVESQTELNLFLRSHRVLKVERQFVADGEQSFWTFCVDYLDGAPNATGGSSQSSSTKTKVDYREVLKPDEFALFAKLRDFRKQVAQAESVPVYVVFTNEQLAQVVQQGASSLADLEKIDGIGGARAEKYGQRLLDSLAKLRVSPTSGSQP